MCTKKDVEQLRAIVERLPAMSTKELENISSKLKRWGVTTDLKKTNCFSITCPHTGLLLASPCCLEQCSFFVENDWVGNCVLEYLEEQNKSALEVNEIAFLLKLSPDTIQDIIDAGLMQLRENSEENVGIEGSFHRKEQRTYKTNLADADKFVVTKLLLNPPFMDDMNAILEEGASSESVAGHPAVSLLGVLDSIVREI